MKDPGCDENANCINDPGTYHCECLTGFDSPLGQATVGDCIPGNECDDVPSVCPEPNGVCVDLHPNENGYRCECLSGWEYVPITHMCQVRIKIQQLKS